VGKYKKGVKSVGAIDYVLASSIVGLSILGIGLLATIIAAPAVITAETITIAAGMLFTLSRQVNIKLKHKSTKHEKWVFLVKTCCKNQRHNFESTK